MNNFFNCLVGIDNRHGHYRADAKLVEVVLYIGDGLGDAPLPGPLVLLPLLRLKL